MEIGSVFLILDKSLEANRETLVLVPGGDFVDVFILDSREDYLVIEADGVPIEARPWQEGDSRAPLHPDKMDNAMAWTVHGIEGRTRS